MILVAYRHGLRASEVCDLRWEQIDFNSATLHVPQSVEWQAERASGSLSRRDRPFASSSAAQKNVGFWGQAEATARDF